jgi:hypothetical protein
MEDVKEESRQEEEIKEKDEKENETKLHASSWEDLFRWL